MKSALTASMGIPAPLRRIPVCPVPINSTFLPFDFIRSEISHAVVIFPVSQSVPTINKTGIFRLRHEPLEKRGGSGGRLRSVMVTLFALANS